MGGTLAATSQAAKTTTRALINTSPEPFSNVGASLAEDTVSLGAIWLALTNPLVFAAVLLVVVIAMWLVIWALALSQGDFSTPARHWRCAGSIAKNIAACV
jgi:hypothetical protein